jgi:signal transduction histidine kinase
VVFGWPGLDTARTSLRIRAYLLAICAILAVTFHHPFSRALLPALVLVVVSVVGLLPVTGRLPDWLALAAEALIEALLLGSMGTAGAYYVPYLLVPIMAIGMSARTRVSLGISTLIPMGLLGAAAAARPDTATQAISEFAIWLPMFGTFPLLATSIRRIRAGAAPRVDPAYLDAHRLLSELHVVSRQLSLGLDPPTLAIALLDAIREQAPVDRAAVLVRTERGALVPLAGDNPGEDTSAAGTAWDTAEPVARVHPDGTSVLAIPVRMGPQVVAVVWLGMPEPANPLSHTRDLQALVAQAGPRLSSALLFDDVRQLATVDERNRLAREIHDGIAQDLASLGYLVDDIRHDTDGETTERLATVSSQIRTMVNEVRLRIFDLRAAVDESTGLGAAVTEYVQRVASQTGLTVNVTLREGTARLARAVEVELLRILQEAVTNVRRHARASTLWVDLAVEAPRARLVVTDDGRGMRPGRVDSMGITGMRERAARIGAELSLAPARPQGTRVEVTVAGGVPARISLPTQTHPAAGPNPPSGETLVMAGTGTPGTDPGEEAAQ